MSRRDAPTRDASRGTWYVAAVVLLGAALQRNFGFYDALGVLLIVLALAAGAAGIYGIGLPARWGVDRVIKVGLLAQLLFMAIGRQGQEILLTPSLNLWPYAIGLGAITAAVLGQLLGRWRADAWGFPVVLLAVAGLGVWSIWSSPSPHIDVFVFHQQGSRALLDGVNPYQVRFPDIYGPGSPFYGPGLSNGHQTLFGFPYPPLSLLFAAGGYALGGDYRYAILAAYLLAAVLIALSGEARRARFAAQLLLLVPTNLFMIEQGWNEPFAAALVALTVFLEVRRPRLAPVALGLVMAAKQYLIGIPAVAWYASTEIRRREAVRGVVTASVVTVVVTLPFVLLAPNDFVFSVIGFQLQQPFRVDALNLAGLIHAAGGPELPAFVGFVALGLGLVAGIRWEPRSAAGFAGILGVSYLAFFLFGRWAFGNYYWFVIACLCSAIRIAVPEDEPTANAQHLGRGLLGRRAFN